ncbi:MAG: FkbM family methyltransferase [Candidatus Poseidoniaceae archaeon]|nr:FkbM family methyltransferase [Candidatus Poseidoniaceae archaeon]
MDKKMANSKLDLYVHDQERGLLRELTTAERVNWSLESGKACDAVPWLDRITPLIGKNDTVFDVGANIGVVCHWFADRCAVVHAFEPHPGNFNTIKNQIDLRNMTNISLHSTAVGKENTTMKLHVKGFHGHHSLGDVDNSPTIEHIDVDVKRLDALAKELEVNHINFLKIDVEGFEVDVLLGAQELLANKQIDYVLFELQDSILHSINRTSRQALQPLFDAGYEIIDLHGKLVGANDSEQIVNGDYLACIDGAETAKKLGSSPFELI